MKLARCAALFAAVPAIALAQGAAAPAQEDKPVTRAEINAKLDADYADLDSNKDGKATPEEINARLQKGAEDYLAMIRKARDDAFAKLDTNGDCSVSKAQ